MGPRPRVVARPDGADVAPARRADDARLARLVRDLEQRSGLAAPDAEPEPALPLAGSWVVPHTAPRRDARPGDAALAERERQLALVAERELRARDDGALHARRRPRVHRAGRSPAGTRTYGLPKR